MHPHPVPQPPAAGPSAATPAPGRRPAPSGTRLRRPTWTDLDAVAALLAAASLARVGRITTRPDDLRARWLGLEGFDDLLLVERDQDGLLVAYAAFDALVDPWTGELDLHVDVTVHPEHTGRGLATFLLGRAEDRAVAAAREQGLDHAVLRTAVVDGDDATRDFFHARGFRPVRHLLDLQMDLHAAPPAPVWPSGVTCRAYRPGEDDEALWRTHQAAFADVPTYDPMTLEDLLDTRVRADPDFDPALVLLAVHDDTPIGVAICRAGTPVAPEDGWVRDLGVVPAWRRHGIGMALLRTAFGAFRARGLTGAALEVDDVTVEGAVQLYRRAGMRVTRRTDVVERVLPVPSAD